MKLGIILNTSDPETAWNALRLANEALEADNQVSVFLLGSGVEIEGVRDGTFDVAGVLRRFLDGQGELLACGTCLELRDLEAGVCPISTMSELVKMVSSSDRVLTFG